MMTRERVHTVETVFLPHHSFVTSTFLSCHNQISLSTQIRWPFPDFKPCPDFHWPESNSRYFQVSKNSKNVVTPPPEKW